jgi:hypothetical protein
MTPRNVLRWCAPLLLAASGVLVSAQAIQLPSAPQKAFGGSVSPAYDGWFDNPDGTHNFLIGYYSRNTQQEEDVPIGPNNHFEPGDPDRGQPTHFLPRRHYGMFIVTVPKDFGIETRLTWVLTVNGTTIKIPFHMHRDYNVSPLKGSQEESDGTYDTPPVIRFEANGKTFTGPISTLASATTRTATVGTPMPLDIWADDDGKGPTGGGGRGGGAIVTLSVDKYRGPATGKVEVQKPIKIETLKGGKPMEPYSGKAATTVKFSEPGDYVLQVTANDASGNGGGGSVCCWTDTLIKVAVK